MPRNVSHHLSTDALVLKNTITDIHNIHSVDIGSEDFNKAN